MFSDQNAASSNGSEFLSGRRRRAVCNFCGDFYSWLYGTVTTDDLSQMLDAIKNDFNPVVSKVNDALSQQQVMIDVLNKSLTAIKSNFGTISNQTTELKPFSQRVVDHIKSVESEKRVNDQFEVFLSSSLVLNTYLDSISLDMQVINNWYASLKHSLQAQTLDLDLIKRFKMRDLIKEVNDQLPSDLTIPPTWSKLRYMRNNMASIAIRDHSLLVTVSIPIVVKSDKMSYWSIMSVPHSLVVNGEERTKRPYIASELNVNNRVVIMDNTNNRWLSVTGDQTQDCWNQMASICQVHTVWKYYQQSVVRLYDDVAALMVDKQHWLVSILIHQTTMYQSCSSRGMLHSDNTEEVVLKGMNLIQIPPNCEAKIGRLKMRGFQQLGSETRLNMEDNGEALATVKHDSKTLPVVVESIKSTLSILANDTDPGMLDLPHLNETLFQFGEVEYGDLRKKLENLSNIKLLDLTMSNSDRLLTKIKSKEFHWPSCNVTYWIGVTVGGCILILVLGYCIRSKILTPRQATAGGFVGLPLRTLSLPVNGTLLAEKNMTEAIGKVLDDHMKWFNLGHICISLMMLLIMTYCYHRIHHKIYPVLGRLLSLNQIFPQAVNMHHHPGECPITVTILIEVTSILKA
uniref:Uncharacterized protein n=1 Tax=Glossina brevipalpis TaxID=37001 RepID=A0A1A9WIL8_9MUSC